MPPWNISQQKLVTRQVFPSPHVYSVPTRITKLRISLLSPVYLNLNSVTIAEELGLKLIWKGSYLDLASPEKALQIAFLISNMLSKSPSGFQQTEKELHKQELNLYTRSFIIVLIPLFFLLASKVSSQDWVRLSSNSPYNNNQNLMP